MDMQGDIHVWTEKDKARATLTLMGPEGQVTITAEAPLAAARHYVERALAARGKNIAVMGADELGALADEVGRSRALRLLRKVAPALFLPAGYLTLAAARRLRRRRHRNRRPVTPWRGKRLGPAPQEPLPTEPQLEDEDQQAEEREGGALEQEAPEYEDEGQDQRNAAAGIGAAQAGIPAVALAASPQLQAGAALLSAAKTSPKAARRVHNIFRRARRGHPQARKQARVLVAAQKAKKEQDTAMRALVHEGTEPPPSNMIAAARLPPPLPALPGQAVAPPQLLLPPVPPASSGPGLRVFETWRRGIV
jgi:hypothetical protein